MSQIDEFGSLLTEVVQAKRLSASKMGKLTETALKCMEHDTQMVSILYRTHKSLAPASKVPSLYVFDALARAAKSQINKMGLSADAPSGNAATFLAKLGAVIEGVFQDVLDSAVSEGKEKTKKILDIWIKGNTFPADLLSRLSDILKGTEKASKPNTPLAITDTKPETIPQPTAPVIPPTGPPSNPYVPMVPIVDPQATLLALLAQAANSAVSSNLQTNVNTPPTPASFAAMPFAVLQQLTHSAAAAVPNIQHTSTSGPPAQKPRSRSPIPDDPRRPARTSRDENRSERYNSPENARHNDNYSDHRPYPRPSDRGHFRGRGIGDRRRWDDRDRGSNNDRERGWSPRARGPTRSQSPPSTYGEKRADASTPPRSAASSSWSNNRRPKPSQESGKDEFGRDIRPPSPESSAHPNIQQAAFHSNSTTIDTADQESSTTSVSNKHDAENMTAVVAPITSSATANAGFDSNTISSHLGMESFDFSSFDLRSPASWEALGKMWQVTYGCAPTDEQLMQFVMSMGTVRPALSQGQWKMKDQGAAGHSWGGGRGTGGHLSRGRGGFHGNGRTQQRGRNYEEEHRNQDTDAIVLGGGDSNGDGPVDYQTEDPVNMEATSSSYTGPGKMQKLGDKWVFIRGTAADKYS